MSKITGMEEVRDIPSKVLLLYEAVEQLIMEGADIKDIRVSTITDKAGIGKGTAYDYFDSKEEILACAVIFYMRKAVEELSTGLAEIEHFTEQVSYLIEKIEQDDTKQQYLTKYVFLMTDTSGLGRMVHERLHAKDVQVRCPLDIYRGMVARAKERGEIRSDLPVDYMVYVLFSKIIFYMICIGEDSLMPLDEKAIRPFVCQSILNELCEKKV